MTDENSSLRKWVLGLLATILSGVVVYYLTEGRRSAVQAEFPSTKATTPSMNLAPASTPVPVSFTSAAPEAVEFTVIDQLGSMQVSEDVQIYIEGRLVASLVVNVEAPETSTKIKVASPGNYAYTVLADAVFVNQFGQLYRTQGRGDGVVSVNPGSAFTLAVTMHGIRMIPQ